MAGVNGVEEWIALSMVKRASENASKICASSRGRKMFSRFHAHKKAKHSLAPSAQVDSFLSVTLSLVTLPQHSAESLARPLLSDMSYTLILPSLGVNHLCQLAIDLLLNTLLSRGVPVEHESLLGVTTAVRDVAGHGGHFAHASSTPVSSLDLYRCPTLKLAFVTQRAEARANRQEQLVADILSWATSHASFEHIVLVSPASAITFPDAGGHALAERTRFLAADDKGQLVEAAAMKTLGFSSILSEVCPPLMKDRKAAIEKLAAPYFVSAEHSSSGGGGLAVAGAAGGLAGSTAVTERGFLEGEEEKEEALKKLGLLPAACAMTARLFSSLSGTGLAPVYFRRFLSLARQQQEGAAAAFPSITALFFYANEGGGAAVVEEAEGLARVLAAFQPTLGQALLEKAGAAATAAAAGKKKGKKAAAAAEVVEGGAAGAAAAGAVTEAVLSPADLLLAPSALKDAVVAARAQALAPHLLVEPSYWAALHGPPVDTATGLYGF